MVFWQIWVLLQAQRGSRSSERGGFIVEAVFQSYSAGWLRCQLLSEWNSDMTRLSPKSQNLNVYQEPRASGMDWMRHLWETFVQNPLFLLERYSSSLWYSTLLCLLAAITRAAFFPLLYLDLFIKPLISCCIFDCLLIFFRHACVSSTYPGEYNLHDPSVVRHTLGFHSVSVSETSQSVKTTLRWSTWLLIWMWTIWQEEGYPFFFFLPNWVPPIWWESWSRGLVNWAQTFSTWTYP